MDYRTENGVTLDYDYDSQPQAVTAVSGGQSFAYDASGQRVKTVQPDGRIRYTPFPTYEEEVWPVAATTPVVTLMANGQTAVTIPPNTAFTLQWQASNAFACEAGGSWSGSKPLNGSQNFKGFNSGSRTYSLTCSNISGSTSRSVTVQIGYGFDLPLAVVIVPLGGPTSGQTTIQRSTYSLAGQATAVRVAGNPLATNNGLFYLYSDHASALLSTGLGSASALVTGGGQKVNETRYLPFGGYRSGSPNALTDRGFTGHKENMTDLGLIYMNARFYAPYLNRFLSADTVVPNPTNPQSFNRYSYSLNNPINYTDPDGHNPAYGATILMMVVEVLNVHRWLILTPLKVLVT
ncbi:MAG: RHS repeat-associated core domain-containing protein [Chloroflexi bacterium]|nr:RHS repeat-associated core domain-containing protein [Chloroflexota bacterium]MBP7045000.1 RHS repeat-associated core domain-containing protein [Chloroflexota bacterium]